MRLIAGCPIAHRAWALPKWFECLAAQTRRPNGFVFIHSGQVNDDTWRGIQREAARYGFQNVRLEHDPSPAHPRHDNERFATLARIRNQLLGAAQHAMFAERFLSLDSDVMLEDPRTIEKLEELLDAGECDLASPVTWLHPLGEGSWAFNAGWWAPGGRLGDPQRAWTRLEPSKVPWGELVNIDVPMAVWLGNERALSCRYEQHESGEDLGFAHSIERNHVRCLWDTSLKCRHIWCEQDLIAEQEVAG